MNRQYIDVFKVHGVQANPSGSWHMWESAKNGSSLTLTNDDNLIE